MRTKILLTIVFFFSVIAITNAQINKGDVFLGGSAGYTNYKNYPAQNIASNYTKAELLAVSLQAGKVVKSKAVLGFTGSYSYSNNKYGNSDSNYSKTNRFSAGVFYRKYKMLLKNFYFFGEADALYFHENDKNLNFYSYPDNFIVVTNGGSVSFTPGISYKVCKTLYIELLMPNLLSASYSSNASTDTQGSPSIKTTQHGHVFSANANLNTNLLNSLGIGFKFIFG